MEKTGQPEKRRCPQCQQEVHWVSSYVAFKQAAQQNLCIAFEPTEVLLAAERVQPKQARNKQFLLLEKQKLSLKQLTHVKRYVHPDWSLRQLRDSYHNKQSVIKYERQGEDVDYVANILRGIGVQIDVKREDVAET